MKTWIQEHHPNVAKIGQLVRYEVSSALAHLAGKISPRQRALLRRLRQSRGLRVNVAGGLTRFENWINVDARSPTDIRVDLRRRLPLADGSVTLLFCEHFCDLVTFPHEVSRVLAEFYRIMEPGGRARLIVQDGPAMMRAYFDRDDRYFESIDPNETMMMKFNHRFRLDGFRPFCYDFETFELLLRRAGFSQVVHCPYRKGENPEIILEYDHPLLRELNALCVEAVKFK